MSDIAAGEIVVVRDEAWLVRSVHTTAQKDTRLEVSGVSELVRDQNAVFYDTLDSVAVSYTHLTLPTTPYV